MIGQDASKRHPFVCVLCFKIVENINFIHPGVICKNCIFKEKSRIASSNKRKIIKKLSLKKISYRDWISILKRHNYSCALCFTNNRKKLTLDHIVPLHKGGDNTMSNIQPLCYLCHMHKDGWAPKRSKQSKKIIKNFINRVMKLINKLFSVKTNQDR